MAHNSQLPTHCPVCRYDLTGLPKNYTCPECGFEYDETMRVWFMPVIPRWVLFLAGVLIALALSATAQFGQLLTNVFGLKSRDVPVVLFALAAIVPFIGLFYPRGWVAAGRKGIAYRFPLCAPHVLSWSEIQFSSTRQRLFRVRNGRRSLVTLPTIGLPWRRRVRLHGQIAGHRPTDSGEPTEATAAASALS